MSLVPGFGRDLCVSAYLPQADERTVMSYSYASRQTGARVQVAVGARLASTTTRFGTPLPINGNVVGLGQRWADETVPYVRLQRWVGGAWTNVSYARVRESGRYTVLANPSRPGTHSYRVWFPSQDRFVGRTTPTFRITVL